MLDVGIDLYIFLAIPTVNSEPGLPTAPMPDGDKVMKPVAHCVSQEQRAAIRSQHESYCSSSPNENPQRAASVPADHASPQHEDLFLSFPCQLN